MPQLWAKVKGTVSSIVAFGLYSFILLLLRNQTDRSLVYLICVITAVYVVTLSAEHRLLRDSPETVERLTKRTRLIFRWVYVAMYLTIIIANLRRVGWNGNIFIADDYVKLKLILFMFVALTIPRDILLRGKVWPWLRRKWSNRKILRKVHIQFIQGWHNENNKTAHPLAINDHNKRDNGSPVNQ
jgi:uncharacterized membrane protein YeiB